MEWLQPWGDFIGEADGTCRVLFSNIGIRSFGEILPLAHSLSGHPAPREKGQVAPTIPSRSTGGGGLGSDFDCDGGVIEAVCTAQTSANGIGVAEGVAEGVAHTLDQAQGQCVAFTQNQAGGIGFSEHSASTLSSAPSGTQLSPTLLRGMQVRRLTPEECEKLQGFEPGYTKISAKTADGPRYRALGNSMAVPVMASDGRRIQMVEEIA